MTKGLPRNTSDLPEALWLECGDYWVATYEGVLWCHPKSNARLCALPKKLRQEPLILQLQTELTAQQHHRHHLHAWVQAWMLQREWLPFDTLSALWADRAWQQALENVVVQPSRDSFEYLELAGLPRTPLMWRGLDEEGRGLWLAPSGEMAWARLKACQVLHPLDLSDLARWQSWLRRLGLRQGVAQLERHSVVKPMSAPPLQANVALSLAPEALREVVRLEGWQWQGGMVRLLVEVEPILIWACVWVGLASGRECQRGELYWVDAHGHALGFEALTPQAYAEGRRLYTQLEQAHTL